MAPITRSKSYKTPPQSPSKVCEADIIKKTAFFHAYDTRQPGKSLAAIARECNTTSPSARRWLRQRTQIGSPVYRHTRKRATRLGRPPKLQESTFKMLVSPSQNPVRDQLYEAQIEYHKLDVHPRTIQRGLKKHTNGGQRYKQAYIQKQISPKNKQQRVQYGKEHQDKMIDDFWQYVIFTDEAHIDPSSQAQGSILRERGTRYDTVNIQERGEKTGVRLHVAGWINWHAKSEKLEFYKDEVEYTEKPKRPPKPRKTMYESQEEYQSRILEWEAAIPHEKEVKPKGNAMTQKYYTERLLPVYIKAVQNARIFQDNGHFGHDCGHDWLLQEDGDPSHGKRKFGMAQKLKKENWISNLVHPAQSPDLNPIEAIWNILKQRIRRRTWRSLEELKMILQEEWSKITMQEVRARILEMPARCKSLIKTGGGPIKSSLW